MPDNEERGLPDATPRRHVSSYTSAYMETLNGQSPWTIHASGGVPPPTNEPKEIRQLVCSRCSKKLPINQFHGCGACRSCCQCFTCQKCKKREVDTCHLCTFCQECCTCSSCPSCTGRCRAFCPDCQNCSNCCRRVPAGIVHWDVDSHSHTGIVRTPLTFWQRRSMEKVDPRVPSSRFIGAEIEVWQTEHIAFGAPRPLQKVIDKWTAKVVQDGSLRDDGFEITTAPAQGPRYIEQVSEICDALKSHRAAVTNACGCHVHIDARDFSDYEIKRLLYLYTTVEDALYELIPEERRMNRYCIPCRRTFLNPVIAVDQLSKESVTQVKAELVYDVKKNRYYEWTREERSTYRKRLREAILQGVYGRKDVTYFREVKKTKGSCQNFRYRNLNLHSWFFRGTIEFRMLEGTLQPNEIIMFGSLMATLLDRASSMSEKDVLALYKDNKTPSMDKLLNAICETVEQREWVIKRWKGDYR